MTVELCVAQRGQPVSNSVEHNRQVMLQPMDTTERQKLQSDFNGNKTNQELASKDLEAAPFKPQLTASILHLGHEACCIHTLLLEVIGKKTCWLTSRKLN